MKFVEADAKKILEKMVNDGAPVTEVEGISEIEFRYHIAYLSDQGVIVCDMLDEASGMHTRAVRITYDGVRSRYAPRSLKEACGIGKTTIHPLR